MKVLNKHVQKQYNTIQYNTIQYCCCGYAAAVLLLLSFHFYTTMFLLNDSLY